MANNNYHDRDDISYEIVAHLGVIKAASNGWTKELNIVRWNGGEPKLDIREWSKDHLRMSRGITLTKDEMETIIVSYGKYQAGELMKSVAEAQTEE